MDPPPLELPPLQQQQQEQSQPLGPSYPSALDLVQQPLLAEQQQGQQLAPGYPSAQDLVQQAHLGPGFPSAQDLVQQGEAAGAADTAMPRQPGLPPARGLLLAPTIYPVPSEEGLEGLDGAAAPGSARVALEAALGSSTELAVFNGQQAEDPVPELILGSSGAAAEGQQLRGTGATTPRLRTSSLPAAASAGTSPLSRRASTPPRSPLRQPQQPLPALRIPAHSPKDLRLAGACAPAASLLPLWRLPAWLGSRSACQPDAHLHNQTQPPAPVCRWQHQPQPAIHPARQRRRHAPGHPSRRPQLPHQDTPRAQA